MTVPFSGFTAPRELINTCQGRGESWQQSAGACPHLQFVQHLGEDRGDTFMIFLGEGDLENFE